MTRKRHAGFTLIELIIFIVVVAVGLTGILSVMNMVVKSSADPLVRKQAVAVAEAMLEEILLKNYSNPVGGYSGATRAFFDDVSDYNGYSTSTGIVDVSGAAVPGLGNYNFSPAVTVAASTDLTGVAAKKVVVTVTGQGEVITLIGYRTNY